jgi:tetratricopeptide (TPR) repeat protein
MVAYFASSTLRSLLLVCYTLTPFWFRNQVLQSALQSFHHGNDLSEQGKYKKATRQFQQSIFLGRPIVLQLQKGDQSKSDNPYLALEWLTQTYVASSRAHLRLGDYPAARRDAWGACLLQPSNQAALQCLVQVCRLQKDKIGELSTLKMFLSALCVQQQEYTESGKYSLRDSHEEDENALVETEWDLLQLKTRIAQLQEELDETYSKQRNDTHVVHV